MSPHSARNPHGLVLYDHPSSPCARRVRITLLEKGLVWETQTIDLSRLEQRRPEYLALNPNGVVPTLAHGERVVYESNVITEYLDDVFSAAALYPDDPRERVEVKTWQSRELELAKQFRPLMYQRLLGPMIHATRSLDEALAFARRSTQDDADLVWEERVWRMQVLDADEERAVEGHLVDWLVRLEHALDGRDWLVGERFGQAEISVYPRVFMFPFVGVAIDEARFPRVTAWMGRLEHRPSFEQTLSRDDRAVVGLARSGVLAFLRRVLLRPPEERSFSERARLSALRAGLRRALGVREVAKQGALRPLRRPARGAIAPESLAQRRPAHPDPALRAEPLLLHDHAHAPHARRVRWLLAELGAPHQRIPVDVERLEHRSPAFLALSPAGAVPVLVHGTHTLADSALIGEWLCRVFEGADATDATSLLPADPWRAAQMRMWVALEAGTHKELRPLFWLHVLRPSMQARGLRADTIAREVAPGVDAAHVAWARSVLEGNPRFDSSETLARRIVTQKLAVLEAQLSTSPFLAGPSPTLADLAWGSWIDLLPRLGIEIDRPHFPHLSRWGAVLRQRPAYEKSAG